MFKEAKEKTLNKKENGEFTVGLEIIGLMLAAALDIILRLTMAETWEKQGMMTHATVLEDFGEEEVGAVVVMVAEIVVVEVVANR